jgi:hypothetical protein
MKKIITLLFITSLLLMNNKQTHAQVTIEDINFQLRDMYKNLKRSPDSVPFLFDMSSHVIDDKLYRSVNDSDYISKGLFLTMYEEMRSAAYDTSIMEPSEIIEERMRKRSRNDTVNISILNADYATFLDDAFMNEGQYYNLTDTTINDVANRTIEPFLLKNVFVSTLTTPLSYFRKVIYRIDSSFVFSKKEFHGITNRDLDPDYARWKIDFGEGGGWREFNPLVSTNFLILYPDTGAYDISIAVFYCDPYPMCNTYPSKLSKTSIYILNNAVPKDPDLTYDNFPNITVGLYKGCGEMKGGVYIPQKPFIIVEGIDLLNTRSIPVLYDENVQVNSSKKLGLLAEYNYDFYIVNFNDTHLDMRENAQGMVALLDYLKSIMNTNEQFVVFAESMGGIIARYALTYMENDLYTQNPNANKPTQMHNTRLYISNDAPHQGATVPASVQAFYRNTEKSIYYKILKGIDKLIPLVSDKKYWNDALNHTSVQQLLAFHIDANGPHPNRVQFMNELIALNPQTNGYPAYTKMIAFTDGLLSGQQQLKIDNTILNPGDNLFELDIMLKVRIFKRISIDLLREEIDLKAVDVHKPFEPVNQHNTRFLKHIKFKGCLRSFLRLDIPGYIKCGISYDNSNQVIPAQNYTSNYDTEAAGFFSILSILYDNVDAMSFHNKFFQNNAFIDLNTGELKTTFTSSKYSPLSYLSTPEIHIRLKIASKGFAFIPVHSAIDFDYHKTLNISTDYNLLQHNVQDFLLAHSPFHVISGFNYIGEKYPFEAKAANFNANWSHGYIENLSISVNTIKPYLNREIGDDTLYLNNLNLGKRNADFVSKNIIVGNDNPHYSYSDGMSQFKLPKINYVYSKSNPFHFIEPSVVKLYYQDNISFGDKIINEGILNISKTIIKPCSASHKKINNNIQEDIVVFPNPFESHIYFKNVQSNIEYEILIYNLLGQIEIENKYTTTNNTLEICTEKLSTNNIYIVKLIKNGELINTYKLIKTN